MVRQNRSMQEGVRREQLVEERKQDRDYIELAGINKIRDLGVEDKYNVLEHLIKELVNLKGTQEYKDMDDKKRRMRRRHSSSEDYDSEEEEREMERKKRREQRRKERQGAEVEVDKKKGEDKKKDVKISVDKMDATLKKEADEKLESISIDEND